MTESWMIGSFLLGLQISICAAMPITNGDSVRPPGNWSAGTTVLFAVLSFMGIGTLLGACLCCRRRKRGFEEFKNETPGNIEVPRTEYPIFGALSNHVGGDLEETRPSNHVGAVQAANICTTNGSHSPPLIVNVNEVQTNHIYSAPINHDFDNNNGPISPSDMENIENNNAGDYIANRNEIGVVVEPSINAINRNIVNSAPSHEDAIVHESCVVLDIEEVSGVPNTQFDSDSMLPVISTKSQSFLENLNLRCEFSQVENVSKDDGKDCDTKSIDSGSISEEGSGNSEIEEALMALQDAIADEDTCDLNDDDDTEATYEDVLKNLMVDNVERNGECGDECKYRGDIDEIEAVAIKLVDSVLFESEKIIGNLKEDSHKVPDTTELLEKSVDSLEETFFTTMQSNKLLQSTPSVTNKVTHIDTDVIQRVLFDDDNSNIEINPEAGATFVKPTDGTFVCEREGDGPTIVIEKEKDEVISVDLTTITPVNTPIEINSAYTVDSWYPQPSTSKAGHSGWFLHPQKDDAEEENAPKGDETFKKTTGDETFEVAAGDEDDDDEENERNLDVTFDALRRQLEQVLPHAQGMANPMNFSEDEENFQDNREVFPDFAIEGASNVQSAKEIIINYQRRPLSPIAEESEDETTFKTFIMNEAKYQDSTSTGCMETGEAIMGVSKTLMASNDTLFNFEDTLGDRDDQFSSPQVEKRSFPGGIVSPIEPPPSEKKGLSMELNLTKTIEVNDLCSPEGAKTFSEDHLSSDLDPDATYTTNTIEGETCISVAGIANNTFVEDDERISEISEPDWNSDLTSTDAGGKEAQDDVNSLLDVDELAVEEIDNALGVVNGGGKVLSETESDNDTVKEDEEPPPPSQVVSDEIVMENGDESPKKERDILGENSDILQAKDTDGKAISRYEGNRKSPPPTAIADTKVEDSNHLTLSTDVLVKDLSRNKFWSDSAPVIYSKHHPIANYNIYEIADYDGLGEESGVILSEGQCLSGEEDPWSSPVMTQNPLTDIRYATVPACEMMSTAFNGDEWDSDGNPLDDEDDSNSSEEFMYLKGLSSAETEKMYEKEVEKENTGLNGPCDSDIWATHKDKVPVHRSLDDSESPPLNSEECLSDVEGEFIPSCWDSMALPVRSAMKSPDKSSSDDDSIGGGKNRRNVIFKVQMYHSVYEYPREVVPLSPAYSEPKVWNHHRENLQSSKFNAEAIDLDGFMVSSSTRPFHNSQFQAQCNTWPSDSDFSWSQLQDGEDEDVKYTNYSSMPVEWPKSLSDLSRQEEILRGSDHINGHQQQQDSEIVAAEVCESTSLGDLCHQKPLLRLPLTTVNVSTMEDEGQEAGQEEEKNNEVNVETKVENDNFILPTPSCTGSMDSLSSSSGSDRPMSFTTFGKTTQSESFEDSLTSSRDGSGDGSNPTEGDVGIDREDLINEVERRNQKVSHERSTRISDSTDEDSGIESVSRIIK
ncbi:uncharacterized protein LOC129806610 isoform X3 [Phlebotomus papatasi]|uniref:uncharacterized protein LOC129806610 isoform X3 n=1 Tax=Phlebotomus papatasi TaxID=29031 RepID=UPI0024839B4C|nr:uncharacterized protein LOC129806610 isoform X3 [Phlebotomus papatasi]